MMNNVVVVPGPKPAKKVIPRKPIFDFAKQLLAWSAIAMLFVQPLGVSESNCNCGSMQQSESADGCSMKVATSSCCTQDNQTSCCSAKKHSLCHCGDQCQCSADVPSIPTPVVPPKDTQTEQTLTLAISLTVSAMDSVVLDTEFGRPSSSAHRPAVSAQQTCVLLSRFTC